jgi:hypothetical protein
MHPVPRRSELQDHDTQRKATHHRLIDLYETNRADLLELLPGFPVYQGYGLDFP